MNTTNKTLAAIAAGVLLLAIGAAGGWWWSGHGDMPAPAAGAMPESSQGESQVLYWYDPMYPQQRFDKPGKSPFMDMELVPKYADGGNSAGSVQIDPAVTQNLGLRQAMVERIALDTAVEASGIIGFNERDVSVEQARAGGFVERVWPLAPGDVIAAGQPLAELLVPEWAAAQHELLAVRAGGDAALLAAARDRLRLLGMPEKLIREVERTGQPRTRFVASSSRAGVVQSLDVRAGMTVMPGQTLARINGLATVWLEAAVPESSAGGIRPGGKADAQIAAFPGKTITGRITAILPALADATRSLRVRVELPNRDGSLRPGMSAQVRLTEGDGATALAVPTEAIIRTGKRSVVMVVEGEGRFAPVEVTLGREAGDRTVITSGLSEGQKIVSSGQFLLDSEASLSGVLARSGATQNGDGAVALHEADATVEAIEDGEVTLAHGPFKTLAMPGMTMAFPLARPDLAGQIKAGDRVRVGVRQTDDGLVVERIEKMGNKP